MLVKGHTSSYAILNTTGLNDPRLSFAARGVLAYFQANPGQVDVEELVGEIVNPYDRAERRKEIVQALRELRSVGYVSRVSILDNERWNVYDLPLKLQNNGSETG
jgi:hypothetical protein